MATHPATRTAAALPGPLAYRAREVASLIARRLADTDAVVAAAQDAERQSGLPFAFGGTSLGNGFGGLALLHWYAARAADDSGDAAAAERWRAVAHRQIRTAADSTREYPVVFPGLIDGAAGFAAVLGDCARDERRWGRSRDTLDADVARQVLAADRPRASAGLRADSYDVVAGAAGILNYLAAVPQPGTEVSAAVTALAEYLAWLGAPTGGKPRWFIAPDGFPLPEYRAQFPHGYLNVGLSHGVPGPLAALATAWRHGHRVPGHAAAMRHIADWLRSVVIVDAWGPAWPVAVPVDAAGRQVGDGVEPSRAGWCYGAPGVAAALWAAGTALDDAALRDLAVRAVEAVLERRNGLAQVYSPTFCHGLAGVLAVTDHLGRASGSRTLRGHVPLLVTRLLDAADPDLPLGVRDEESPGRHVDSPGLLTGAAGVALALFAAASDTPAGWYRTFGIA